MKYLKILFILSTVSTLILGSGCTSLPKHTQTDIWKARCPNISVKVEDIDAEKAKPSGEYNAYKEDFEKEFNKFMTSKDIIKEGDPVTLDVRLKYEGGISTFGQYLMGFITTPLIFLTFVSSPHTVPYVIDYSVKDSAGMPILNNRLEGRIRGGFKGWSFLRFISRTTLFKEQGKFFSDEAAIVVFNDISKKWIEDASGDTKTTSTSPDNDYRLQARKMIRVEQLLKQASIIYPEGKELKQLRERLDRVKARNF